MQALSRSFFASSLLLIVAGLLAGCGGGGGASGGAAAAPAAIGTSLGSRILPGCEVAVEKVAGAVPGTWSVRVRLSPNPAGLASLGVRVASDVGSEGYVAAAGVAGEPGIHAITIAQPTTSQSGQRVWVRIALSDGSVLESGSDDFAL